MLEAYLVVRSRRELSVRWVALFVGRTILFALSRSGADFQPGLSRLVPLMIGLDWMPKRTLAMCPPSAGLASLAMCPDPTAWHKQAADLECKFSWRENSDRR